MKTKLYYVGTLLLAVLTTALITARICSPETPRYSVTLPAVSPDPNTIRIERTVTDLATVQIHAKHLETPAFASPRFEIGIDIENTTDTCYNYEVQYLSYGGDLVPLTPQTKPEISFGEHYSSGNHRQSNRTWYFISDRKTSPEKQVASVRCHMVQNPYDAGTTDQLFAITVYQKDRTRPVAYWELGIHFELEAQT